MLFNSFEFLVYFLPITLFVFFILSSNGYFRTAIVWLASASLFFYAWWNPIYLILITGSILFNFIFGLILNRRNQSPASWINNKHILALGVIGNLGLLGYFKYSGFFIETINQSFNTGIAANKVILPLAISFFTFQQIAYLVDSYRKKVDEHNFIHYVLFVTFFPQLIAGPIVHHKEMMPQLLSKALHTIDPRTLTIGVTIFVIGLAKKVLIADNLGFYADPVFSAASQDVLTGFWETWSGVFAYSFQLYFDFSGYTDMAIGLALMFNVRLPINFNSPYKASNIIEFWRRWHITLSRFLKDYLYIPLGGNRHGSGRRYVNIMATMALGGLWHGAAWTFILWGIFHGILLSINHAWHFLKRNYLHTLAYSLPGGKLFSNALTMLCVSVGWVLFRSDNLHSAQSMLSAMFRPEWNDIDLFSMTPVEHYKEIASILNDAGLYITVGDASIPIMNIVLSHGVLLAMWLIFSAIIIFIAPNSTQIQRRIESSYPPWLAIATGLMLFLSMLGLISELPSEFVYFQF